MVYDVGARATTVGNHPVTLRANVLNVTNKAYWGMPQPTSLGLGAPRVHAVGHGGLLGPSAIAPSALLGGRTGM